MYMYMYICVNELMLNLGSLENIIYRLLKLTSVLDIEDMHAL